MPEKPEEIPTITVSLEDIRPTAIGSQSFAARVDLGGLSGLADLHLLGGPTGRPITVNSHVFASIAEYQGAPGTPRFMGAAKMSVLNIVPGDDDAFTRIFIDWPSELTAVVDFLVIND
ncbi:hypothetical protein ACGFRB_32280 [Streptomyces sp. NPDC048718]|uniref:hypothetical protein n=1 Tax=Streptomyces sp. NPDC048718 TaxID=3365587 RepID=UPI0037145BCF